MANRRRGEVEAIVDGRPRVLCLTLGALCELEAAFAVDDLPSLARRFVSGRLSARDVARVFACGLTGGGTPTTAEEVLAMRVDGGLIGIAATVADLLTLTFGDDTGSEGEAGTVPPPVPGEPASPSPGTN